MTMPEIFNYSFMVRAFLAGSIIGIVAPLIGTFLVAKKFSLIADTLGHISLAGVAIGLIIGINPLISSIVISIIVAIIIDKIRSTKLISGESILAMLLSAGLALAIVLISTVEGFSTDLLSYLFGSLTTVQVQDLYIILPLGIITILIMIFYYKDFLYISFDEEGARVSGVKVNLLNSLLMVLTAIIVSLSIRIVGSLLIGALIVIPVVAAGQVAKSFKQSVWLSVIFGLLSVFIGLFLSYYLNLAAGGTIVLVALFMFFISYIF